MAYVTPTSRSTGDLVTAAIWNQDVVENVKANPAELAAAAGDVFYATGANALARLPIGSAGQVLTPSGGLPAWANLSIPGWFKVSAQTLGAAANGITFSGLSSSVKAWRVSGRVFQISSSTAQPHLLLNGATADYWWASHRQKGTTVTSASDSGAALFPLHPATIEGGLTGGFLVEILVSKPTTGKWAAIDARVTYQDDADSGVIQNRVVGFWRNTAAAISSIAVLLTGSAQMATSSHLTLESLNDA